MSEPEPTLPDDAIEALVRRSLERGAERVDPRPAFDRLQAAWPGSAGSGVGRPRRLRPVGRWAWGLSAAAAVVIVATVAMLQERPALARAEVLVREARSAHRLPLDRCYLVEVRRDSALFDEVSPVATPVRQTRLWTRGDRFWVESVQPKQRWAWGRDERNRFWMAPGPHRGLRLEPDEVPWRLNHYFDLFSLRLERLLDDVLRDFDLRREPPGEGPSSATTTEVVVASPRAPLQYPSLRRIVLEIDRETRVVRRMVIERTMRGEPFATATYTLVDTQTLDDGKFQLEGHLTAPYLVFSPEFEPERRREILAWCFGPRAAWFPLRGEDQRATLPE